MARYTCQRCGVVCHTTDPEHLCKDIARRQLRQARQLAIVDDILIDQLGESRPALAHDIVRALNRAGLHEDA